MSKELEPVAWQFYHNCSWQDGAGKVNVSYPVRYLYAIPEGYALVPVEEATDEMAAAFMEDDRPWVSGSSEWYGNRMLFNRSYAAMIKAYQDATFPPGSVVDDSV